MKTFTPLVLIIILLETAPSLQAQNQPQYDAFPDPQKDGVYISLGYLSPRAKNFSIYQNWGGNLEIGVKAQIPKFPFYFFPALKLSSFSREINAALFDNLLLYQAGIKAGYPLLKNISGSGIHLAPFIGGGYSGGRYYWMVSHHFQSGQHEILKINGFTGTTGTGIFYKRYSLSFSYEIMRLRGEPSRDNGYSYFYPRRRINWFRRSLSFGNLNFDHFTISLAYYF